MNSCIRLGMALLAVALAGCMHSSSRARHPSTLITMRSLGGVRIGDSRATVAALAGRGRRVSSHSTMVVYPRASLTVFYASGDALHRGVYWVRTTSPRYRTAQGIRVGSPLTRVAQLPIMTCSFTRPQVCQSRPDNGAPGLQFDAVRGRVSAIWLVVRTN